MSNGIIQYSNNQCLDFFQSRRLEYDSLKYRSEAEIAIAKAIDEYNKYAEFFDEIYYIPNSIIVTPGARTETSSIKIESDFLIFYHGVTAILEVDGCQHSELSVLKKDAEKERHWRDMKVFVVERFSAKECLQSPDDVLWRFLNRINFIKSFKDLRSDEELLHKTITTYYQVYASYISDNLSLYTKGHIAGRYSPAKSVEAILSKAKMSFPISFDGYKFIVLSTCEMSAEKMKDCSIEQGLGFDFEIVGSANHKIYARITSDILARLKFEYKGHSYANSDRQNDLSNYSFTY